MYSRAGLALDAVLGLLQQSDEGGAAGLGLGELHGRLYLGQHGALGELVLLHILAGFGGGQIVQPLLVGLVEVDSHLLHGGEDDEHIGVQLLGQQLGGEVLVDDGGRALQVVMLGTVDGDAAAAAADDDVAAVAEGADGAQLHNLLGLGGGHIAAPAAAPRLPGTGSRSWRP